jgi:hypothetical protein
VISSKKRVISINKEKNVEAGVVRSIKARVNGVEMEA